MKIYKSTIYILIALILVSPVFGQMARKPSPTREPVGAMSKKPDSVKNSLPKIGSQADFDLIARVYHKDTPFELPHAMFVIDRRDKNKIYFVNSQKYRYHKDFFSPVISCRAVRMYLSPFILTKTAALSSERLRGKNRLKNLLGNCGKAIWLRRKLSNSRTTRSINLFSRPFFTNRILFVRKTLLPNSESKEFCRATFQKIRIISRSTRARPSADCILLTNSTDTVEIGSNEILVLK